MMEQQELTIPFLTDFLERNQHRLVFLKYAGGCSGEWICFNLMNNNSHKFFMPPQVPGYGGDYVFNGQPFESQKEVNRWNYIDPLFDNYFLNTEHTTIEGLAKHISQGFIKNLKLFDSLNEHGDWGRNIKAIIRVQGNIDTSLMPKATYIQFHAGKDYRYTDMLRIMKMEMYEGEWKEYMFTMKSKPDDWYSETDTNQRIVLHDWHHYEWRDIFKGKWLRKHFDLEKDAIFHFTKSFAHNDLINIKCLLDKGIKMKDLPFKDLDKVDDKNLESYVWAMKGYLPRIKKYFGEVWKPGFGDNKYSGWGLLDKLEENETVLDVGCGYNLFKDTLGDRLYGIDIVNSKADEVIAMEDFESDKQWDVLFVLGSINFDTNQSTITDKIKHVLKFLKPGGRIYWRQNPGFKDHIWKEVENIEFFPWTFDLNYEIAEDCGCEVTFIDWDRIQHPEKPKRIYAEWKKL